MKNDLVAIVGSGFSSLSAACYLAKAGRQVLIIEKNNQLGGRARVWKQNDFTFDMGPSWYWMKEIIDNFFADFEKKTSDYYELKKLDIGFKMIFNSDFQKHDYFDISSDLNKVFKLFHEEEKKYGSEDGSIKLAKLLEDGKFTFDKAMNEFMLKKSDSVFEFLDPEFLKTLLKSGVLKSYGSIIKDTFKSPKLQDLLNFPVLFLGGTSDQIPYLYSLMVYTMINGGTHYPMGGMNKIIEAMIKLADSLGVKFLINSEITEVEIHKNKINKIIILDKTSSDIETGFEFAFKEQEEKAVSEQNDKDLLHTTNEFNDIKTSHISEYVGYKNLTKLYELEVDDVICGGDYHHFEQSILPKTHRKYTEKYWDKKILAPSSLIAYVGLNRKLKNIIHHNLFFDTSLEAHGKEIYNNPQWPKDPLFYVCAPSITDESVAPLDCENLFFLMPIAPNLDDSDTDLKEKYFDIMLERLQNFTQTDNLKDNIVVKRLYCVADFKNDYFAYKGNAYGLANTLGQTAIFKPKLKSKKVKNLIYCGQLTVPGPGIPPTIISGKLAASILLKANIENI